MGVGSGGEKEIEGERGVRMRIRIISLIYVHAIHHVHNIYGIRKIFTPDG